MSFAQQRLWFLDQLHGAGAAYNMPGAVLLSGAVDVGVLGRCLSEILRRHEVLRTTYVVREGSPVQVVGPVLPADLPVRDLSGLPAEERDAEARRLAEEEARRPFDLAVGPVIRFLLLRLDAERHVFVWNMHHIASDGWSLGVFYRELSALYAAYAAGEESPLAEPAVQYADFAAWQRQWLQGEVLDSHLAYWRNQLAQAPQLAILGSRSGSDGQLAYEHAVDVPSETVHALRALSSENKCTLFMTILAALGILVGRHAAQEDLVVGVPASGRPSGTDDVVGLFVNTLPVRMRRTSGLRFCDFLQNVRRTVLEALQHRDLPLEILVQELHPERDLDSQPFFDIALNYDSARSTQLRLGELGVQHMGLGAMPPKMAMTFYAREEPGALRLRISAREAPGLGGRPEAILAQYVELLGQIAKNPDLPLDRYSLVHGSDIPATVHPSVELQAPEYEDVSLAIKRWTDASPSNTAVRQGTSSWTYGQLLDRANRVSTILRRRGAKIGTTVAIAVPRSFEFVASVVACLSAGYVLFLVDPLQPAHRRNIMLKEAGAKYLILADTEPPDSVPDGIALVRIGGSDSVETPAPSVEAVLFEGETPAYVFFTSGSTGTPKGILGCRRGLAHFMCWQRSQFNIGPGDRVAQLVGPSFDAIMRDILLPLTSGSELILPEGRDEASPSSLFSWIADSRISVVHTTPTIMKHWLAQSSPRKDLSCLRWLFTSGEPLSDILVRHWRSTFPSAGAVVNLYGATETTMIKSFYVVPEIMDRGMQPAGTALPDTQLLVLNDDGDPCGYFEPGEVVVRTPFRTLGYIGAAAAEESGFRPNRFRDEEELLYWTGDTGYLRSDGLLQVVGRRDSQVKIRGVRVEPAEIELTIGEHPEVAAATVLDHVFEDGMKHLVAYVVFKKNSSAHAARNLQRFIMSKLPSYMIPTGIVAMELLPRTPSGKVDRKSLPRPAEYITQLSASTAEPPTSSTEIALAEIWASLLGISPSLHDNFFDLGGHSLLATQVLSLVQQRFDVELSLRPIFQGQSLWEMAQAVDILALARSVSSRDTTGPAESATEEGEL
ncbi:non-ribosomal peptide synthetase [Streptomyces griseorubiginosus]|uniref:non-ribosomal peptide synthetase n=1 Tax=Streptomyces griseorubiginosus TaxID=67304 RepID=UPI0036E306AB